MLSMLFSDLVLCRGCLRPMPGGGQAGLCHRCWEGLWPLAKDRCPKCALVHDTARPCPDRVAWDLGDALWEYRGGWPPLGQLLIPGIKRGEKGWRRALLKKVSSTTLPAWTAGADLVTPVPQAAPKRLWRGIDLTEEAARLIAKMLCCPYAGTLCRRWFSRRQAKKPEGQRRRMAQKTFFARRGADVSGKAVLLIDDVWTTGTTLLRCAEALKKAGTAEVSILCLFRAV